MRQAFLTAFERMAEFRGEGAFTGWLRRLATRDYLARGRSVGGSSTSEPSPGTFGEPIGPDPTFDIDAALGELSDAERLYVCVCCGAGLNVVELAAAIGTPVETVRAGLTRAVDVLRRRLPPRYARVASADFERRLERALIEGAAALDGAAFARSVERRLARIWATRRLAIALAGVGSALLAVRRIADSSVATRLEATVRSPFALLGRRFGLLKNDVPLLRLLPVSADAVWLLAALVLLAAGLLATRLFDEP